MNKTLTASGESSTTIGAPLGVTWLGKTCLSNGRKSRSEKVKGGSSDGLETYKRLPALNIQDGALQMPPSAAAVIGPSVG
jgi:hypothetical protein